MTCAMEASTHQMGCMHPILIRQADATPSTSNEIDALGQELQRASELCITTVISRFQDPACH